MSQAEILKKIQKAFSNNQKKLFEKIKPLIGTDPSIALVSTQGTVSQQEIEVIANLITQFSTIKIVTFTETPRALVLSGQFSKGHFVQIYLQYKVKNTNPKAQAWAIDLVLELQRKVGNQLAVIGELGIEYDGHISHYVESKIKKAYTRDANILSQNAIPLIKISPESWRKEPDSYRKHIKKFFEHKIRQTEKIQKITIEAVNLTSEPPEKISLVECPVCIGRCMLAGDECSVCNGMGEIKNSIANNIDLSDYERVTCPTCKPPETYPIDCSTCNGVGQISRDKALELG